MTLISPSIVRVSLLTPVTIDLAPNRKELSRRGLGSLILKLSDSADRNGYIVTEYDLLLLFICNFRFLVAFLVAFAIYSNPIL